MDPNTESQFISSLVQCIQAFCHGHIQFSSSIEIIGHIYLNVDKDSKFNYIVNEEVSKNTENTTVFLSHSYHSLPPPPQRKLPGKPKKFDQNNVHVDLNKDNIQKIVSFANDSISQHFIDKTISPVYPVSIIQNFKSHKEETILQPQEKSSKDFEKHEPSSELSPFRFNQKNIECSKLSKQPKKRTLAFNPYVVIKQEPGLSFPHNSSTVRNMTNGKSHVVKEESVMNDEQRGEQVTCKNSKEPNPNPNNIGLEATDLEHFDNNLADLPADSEQAALDTLGIQSTKCLSAKIRQEIVEYANVVGNRPAARHYGVHESSIRQWRKKFGLILQGGGKRGRKRKYFSSENMENGTIDVSK